MGKTGGSKSPSPGKLKLKDPPKESAGKKTPEPHPQTYEYAAVNLTKGKYAHVNEERAGKSKPRSGSKGTRSKEYNYLKSSSKHAASPKQQGSSSKPQKESPRHHKKLPSIEQMAWNSKMKGRRQREDSKSGSASSSEGEKKSGKDKGEEKEGRKGGKEPSPLAETQGSTTALIESGSTTSFATGGRFWWLWPVTLMACTLALSVAGILIAWIVMRNKCPHKDQP